MEVDPRRAARRRSFLRARKYRELYPPAEFGKVYIPRGTSRALGLDVGDSWATATDAQKAQRRQHHYYGPGKYGLKSFGRSLKRAAIGVGKVALSEAKRRAVGMLTGQGMYTGQGAHVGAGLYTGMGAYSNDLVGSGHSGVASVSSIADETGAVVITHKEYITDIYANPSSASFQNNAYPLNPGLEVTFPWLSQIAANYEEYEFKQLMFTYKSVVADVSSTNGQVGTIIMATNYNPSAQPWTDKGEMMTYAHAASSKTSDSLLHGVECDPTKLSGDPGKYTRVRPVVQGEDLKSYDHGLFQIAIANTPSTMANSSIGELWIAYTVVMRKPKILTGRGEAITRFMAISPSAVLDQQLPFGRTDGLGSSTNFAQQNSIPIFLYAGPGNGYAAAGISAPHDGRPVKQSLGPSGTNSDLALVLPGSYSGVLRIIIKIEGTYSGSTAGNPILVQQPFFQGNVFRYNDVYGGPVLAAGTTSAPTDSPSWWSGGFCFTDGASGNFAVSILFHVKVEPASNGLNNVIAWGSATSASFPTKAGAASQQGRPIIDRVASDTVVPTQAYLDISEYNAAFATSNSIDAPVWVNVAGQVVTL